MSKSNTSICRAAILATTTVLIWGCSVRTTAMTADQPAESRARAPWTVLIYGGVDSSAEDHIMRHLKDLKKRSRRGQAAEILLLIDRSPHFSSDAEILGADFADTRLFRLEDGNWHRTAGGEAFPEITLDSNYEANTGDATTLRKFIEFGKRSAPADNYLLLFFGHGICRSICFDESSTNEELGETDDPIYIAEITSELSAAHAVEFAWFDVCSFGAIENAYQFRPGTGRFAANVMLASPPISDPLPIAKIFQKVGFVGRTAGDVSMPGDGTEMARIVTRVIKGSIGWSPFKAQEVWGCYDLTVAEQVKKAVDKLAMAIAHSKSREAVEQIRGSDRTLTTMNYMHRKKGFPRAWVVSPHFDLYDLARRIAKDETMSSAIRQAATDVKEAVDVLIIDSCAGIGYSGFKPGKNGVFILFPDGDAMWGTKTQWSYFGWYHPDDRRGNRYEFGRSAWCRDGATPANGTIENWFEMLDAWYDQDNDQGGFNNYRW